MREWTRENPPTDAEVKEMDVIFAHDFVMAQTVFIPTAIALLKHISALGIVAWRDASVPPPVMNAEFFDAIFAPFGLDGLSTDAYKDLRDELFTSIALRGGVFSCLVYELAHILDHAYVEKMGGGETRH